MVTRAGAFRMLSRPTPLMHKIEAIIRNDKFENVKYALAARDIVGMTVSEVRGFGRQRGIQEHYRSAEYKVDFLPKLKLEVVVDGSQLKDAVALICATAHTGRVGDGKIFVTRLEDVIRIRTGESGPGAI